MFNACQYFETVCNENRMTVDGHYRFCRVTGISYMEDAIARWKRETAFFCVDDTEDGRLICKNGGGFFERRLYTVYLIKKFSLDNMDAQRDALAECRTIYRQIMKRLVRDRSFLENSLAYLNLTDIPFYEIPGYFLAGCTGLYFSVTVDNPVDLCYDGSEWND
jgi:hypothetical protein